MNGYGYKLMKKHVSARVLTVGYFQSIMLDYVPISMLNSPFVADKQRFLSVPNRAVCRLALFFRSFSLSRTVFVWFTSFSIDSHTKPSSRIAYSSIYEFESLFLRFWFLFLFVVCSGSGSDSHLQSPCIRIWISCETWATYVRCHFY